MVATRFAEHLLTGDHASRPAASAVPEGTLYACSDHSLIYQSDTSSWATWADVSGSGAGAVATDAIWDAKADLAAGTGSNTAARLAVGANDTILEAASGETTGLRWSAFCGVRVRAVADVNLTSGAQVYLTFDTEDFDTDAFHSTGSDTSRLVVPSGKGGFYMIGGGAFTTASPGNGFCVLRVDGTTIIASGAYVSGGNVGSTQVATIYSLAAGQYVEFGIQVGAASKAAVDASVVDPSFWMYKLR